MRWPRVTALPVHLVHNSVGDSLTIISWLLLGFAITAFGGWIASRATTSRRVSAGMALTLAGVIVFATGIWYHGSMPA